MRSVATHPNPRRPVADRTPSGAAVLTPSGSRIALPDSDPVTAVQGSLTRDLQLSRIAAKVSRDTLGRGERLFLSFVEDPAIASRQHLELQLDTEWDSVEPDGSSAHLIGAFSFPRLPRLEAPREQAARDGRGARPHRCAA